MTHLTCYLSQINYRPQVTLLSTLAVTLLSVWQSVKKVQPTHHFVCLILSFYHSTSYSRKIIKTVTFLQQFKNFSSKTSPSQSRRRTTLMGAKRKFSSNKRIAVINSKRSPFPLFRFEEKFFQFSNTNRNFQWICKINQNLSPGKSGKYRQENFLQIFSVSGFLI